MICSNTSGDIVFMWYKEMRGEGEVGGVRRGGERGTFVHVPLRCIFK